MGIFSKLFGRKKTPSAPESAAPAASAPAAPPGKPATVSAPKAPSETASLRDDELGREVLLTNEQRLDDVLMVNLEKHRDDPEALHGILASALKDGLAPQLLPYAEHLFTIDPVPSRGTSMLAMIYLDSGLVDDAEQLLEEYVDRHGEDGVVLTCLAKVYRERGQRCHAQETLWHALELDPNQEEGLLWLGASERERGGQAAELEAFRAVAGLPGSWRAHLWLARLALQDKEFAKAEAQYQAALANAAEPLPSDLLKQMSGDLVDAGRFQEVVRLAGPYYHPGLHGLDAGANLLKANIGLGRLKEAERLLQQLCDQERHEWKNTLAFWESELAKAEEAGQPDAQKEPSITVLSIEGPIWMRHGSPCAALLAAKRGDAPRFMVFGSTVVGEKEQDLGRPLSDPAARLSRSLPLLMAEVIEIASEAVGAALIPWVQGEGVALFDRPYPDDALCMMSGGDDAPDYLVAVTIDTAPADWQLLIRLIRRADGERLAELAVAMPRQSPGAAIYQACAELSKLLAVHAGVSMSAAPSWYRLPAGEHVADYLLRLEQQLSLSCQTLDYLEGGSLHGEREMLDGVLALCTDQPKNPAVWMLYAQTLRLMKKVRPELVEPHREKLARLWRDHPVNREVEPFLVKALEEVFAG